MLAAVADRLVALMGFMRQRAAAGDAAFQRHIDAGHLALYQADLGYLRAERERLMRGFAGSG